MAHRDDKKRFIDFILPFLIFVSLGIIVVLSIQLWRTLNPTILSSEAYLYIDQGKAQILPWGINEWEPGFNGSKILQGDVIKLSSKGRAVLTLFDGSVLRLGPNSEIKINQLSEEKNKYFAQFSLLHGQTWSNIKTNSTGTSTIEIQTDNLHTISSGPIFTVENNNDQTVRVIKGNAEIEVVIENDNQSQVAEKIQLSAGKEAILTSASLKAYQDHQSPNVITNIDENFTNSEWYQWNQQQDQNPTDFSNSTTTNLPTEEESATPEASTEPAETTDTEDNTSDTEDKFLSAPVVTNPPKTPYTTSDSEIIIRGTTSSDTTKIVVIGQEDGAPDEYTLQNFEPGDTSWKYTAAVKFGNLQEGSNEFEVYAFDEEDNRSPVAKIIIIYQPKETEATPDSNSN